MSNPLAGVGPSKEWAERAQAAIDQGRKIGAKTPRERDYIETVAAYGFAACSAPRRRLNCHAILAKPGRCTPSS
jgi:hypothetical protein